MYDSSKTPSAAGRARSTPNAHGGGERRRAAPPDRGAIDVAEVDGEDDPPGQQAFEEG